MPGVEVVIAAAHGEKLRMVAPLHDASLFHHQNLVGAADGGEPVGDDEGGAPLHQLIQSRLNHGLGFRVERTRGLIENKDARLRQ